MPSFAQDLCHCTATELLALYRSRATSPVEATRAVLDRIERLNPKLNAFCLVDGESALASARASAPDPPRPGEARRRALRALRVMKKTSRSDHHHSLFPECFPEIRSILGDE